MTVFRHIDDVAILNGRDMRMAEQPPEQIGADTRANPQADDHEIPPMHAWLDQPYGEWSVQGPKGFGEKQIEERQHRGERAIRRAGRLSHNSPSTAC